MKCGISIVTGTLNRKPFLADVIANTVDADDRLELVLVDGGSTDGTLEYLRQLAHPRIVVIEVGGRSSYPSFMNLGIKAARHEIICQWNDDVLMVNPWSDVFDMLEDDNDVYIFSWKKDRFPKPRDRDWILLNSMDEDGNGEIVLNYGLYRKRVFRNIGLYNLKYHFYCADGEMAHRAWYSGCRVRNCNHIKVVALKGVKKSGGDRMEEDIARYSRDRSRCRQGICTDELEKLADGGAAGGGDWQLFSRSKRIVPGMCSMPAMSTAPGVPLREMNKFKRSLAKRIGTVRSVLDMLVRRK
jgi:glycosyltransferase involved in cell wall biosynthesis